MQVSIVRSLFLSPARDDVFTVDDVPYVHAPAGHCWSPSGGLRSQGALRLCV